MPKLLQKTHEEKSIENYSPVNAEDSKKTTEKQEKTSTPKKDFLKKSIEIPVKSPSTEVENKASVEKTYNQPDKKSLEIVEKPASPKGVGKKYSKRKTSSNKGRKKASKKRTTTKNVKYKVPDITLKDKGYELIITEKPQAALKISAALGNAVRKDLGKIPYYEVDRKGEKIIVASAVGHLFTLKQTVPGSEVPIFSIDWVPNYLANKKDFTKGYYDALLKLAKNAGKLTVATDFDIEGEVIGLNIVRFICNQKDANRMKFSTLTDKELDRAYEEKSPTLEWGQAIAGETRHYLDWFYGINLSRALMNAIKTTGKFKIMSIGRVQGPALNLIVQKEREIEKFKSETYWQAFITIEKPKIELKYTKDIFDEKELDKFKDLVGKKVNPETKETKQILPPNPPFNLTTLQTEAYKFHGITPSNTLRAAQSLYLAGLISYPRTSSQKLPKEIGYKEILDKLKIRYKVAKLITKDKPIEGKKTDPAHPSIYPTGEKKILSGDEEKIYELIVKRFLSLFCDDAIIDKKRISVKVNALTFSTSGSSVRKKAWMEIYPSKLKEIELPEAKDEMEITNSRTEEKETQPPNRYSPASIITALEKKNLGTKATRSSILETLYNRNYIKDKSIKATPLGMSLITTLEKHSPIIIDEELTRNFESKMNEIVESKKGLEKKKKKIIDDAKETITKIAKQFEKKEKEIGNELLNANLEYREQEKIENKLCLCPKCKKGNLAITYSKKTRRHFVACDAYPECKTTYSLPPNGTIKKTEKLCEKCGFPLMMALKFGRKPWIFCFNNECETNKERIEEYKKKHHLTE